MRLVLLKAAFSLFGESLPLHTATPYRGSMRFAELRGIGVVGIVRLKTKPTGNARAHVTIGIVTHGGHGCFETRRVVPAVVVRWKRAVAERVVGLSSLSPTWAWTVTVKESSP